MKKIKEKKVLIIFLVIVIISLFAIFININSTSKYNIEEKTVLTVPQEEKVESIAKINSNYYNSLQKAIDSIKDESVVTITLLKDSSENITISNNKKIVLNLNSKMLTNSNKMPVVNVDETSEVTLTNGKIEQLENNTAIENKGLLEIRDSIEIISAGSYATIYNSESATLNILSGKIENTESNSPIGNNGKLVITGGDIISNGKNNAIWNYGTIEIKDNANIKGADYPAIYNHESGILSVFRWNNYSRRK